MSELIPISTDGQGSQVVSARELYRFLGLAEGQFTRWCKSNIEENPFAEEGADYQRFDIHVETPNGGKKGAVDYAVKLALAKKLCMVSKSEKAELVRDYFLECEKVAHQAIQPQPLSQLDILAQSVAILQQQAREIQEVKQVQSQQDQRLQLLEAKTQTTPDYFTVVGYASLNHVQIGVKQAQKIGQQASQICKARGLPTDSTPDPRFGRVNMYPKQVLVEVFNHL